MIADDGAIYIGSGDGLVHALEPDGKLRRTYATAGLIYGAPVLYLHVSPREHKHWGRYCARYQACGRPVQFVVVNQQNRWWENHNANARGEGFYRQPDYRHDNRRDQRDGDRHEHRDENRH